MQEIDPIKAQEYLDTRDQESGVNTVSPAPKSKTKKKESLSQPNELGWKNIPLENLPSKGKFYLDNFSLAIRSATVAEVRHWSTIDETDMLSIDDQLNYILERCAEIRIDEEEVSWKELLEIFNSIDVKLNIPEIADWIQDLNQSAMFGIFRRDFLSKARTLLGMIVNEDIPEKATLRNFINRINSENYNRYNTKLYNETSTSALKVAEVKPTYNNDSEEVDARIILRDNFHHMFEAIPEAMIFGEDVGKIGGVNQGVEGLQDKFGESRVADTGIREATIIGQGIGLSLRGLKPIAEMQYLDYVIYGFQPMVDDIASLHYRTHGGQITPLIIRTRGHRLEGIWHSGSPMGMLLNGMRGMYLCVPRDMTRAAGFYNTLMQSNDPAMVIECLNGYRVKEKLPNNLLEFSVPLGIPEIINEGSDITIVSYGSTLRIVEDAAIRLAALGIDCEVIDVQTLLPFDINHQIVASLKKTNRILFVDEDVPGGATAHMYQQVIEIQGGYKWLDASARTLSAKAHRPAYASDGDYFSKPNSEEVIQVVKEMIAE